MLTVATNTRFSKVIEDDESYIPCGNRTDRDRGQPPLLYKSRFTAAMEEDMDRKNSMEKSLDPPPLPQNSRFSFASQTIELGRDPETKSKYIRETNHLTEIGDYRIKAGTEKVGYGDNDHMVKRDFKNRDCDFSNYNMNNRGTDNMISEAKFGPTPNNQSRFASIMTDHNLQRVTDVKDKVKDRYDRNFGDTNHGDHLKPSGGSRFTRVSRDEFGRETHNRSNNPSRSSVFSAEDNKTLLIAPKLPDHLQPKKKTPPKLPPVEAPLALPGEDEGTARARIERRKKEEAEKLKAEKISKEKEDERKIIEEESNKQKVMKAAELEGDLLKTFRSGEILGTKLAQWCIDQVSVLPSIDKLVLSVLEKIGDSKPDSECKWAEADKFGAAFLSLVEKDTSHQVQILYGIQKYCSNLGFPKVKNEYLIQAMFQSIYKFNLVTFEAFSDWKEDESVDYNEGKMKAIIQTVAWFNWLEEYDDEEYDDDYIENSNEDYFEEKEMYL